VKKITIITPVFQTADIFTLFLEAMAETLIVPTHIIFINDGSPDIINTMITDFGRKIENVHEITLIKNQNNIGCSKSINKALEIIHPNCDIVVFIDSDIILNGDWQKQIINSLNKPCIGIVGGILLYPQTGGIQCCGISFNNTVGRHTYLNARLDNLKLDGEFEVQSTIFAFCAIKYDAIKQVGLLDEQFYNGYEDWDYQFRVRKYGYKAIINTNIIHFHWEKSNGLHRAINRKSNLGRFWLKHGNAVSNDFWIFLFKQLNEKINKHIKQYIGINLCGLRDESEQFWLQVKLQTNIELADMYDYANLCNTDHAIWLPQILDSGSVSNNKPYLFLCDNFVRLLDNDYWYQLRQRYCIDDIVVDLYANSMLINELKNSFWPGTKVR